MYLGDGNPEFTTFTNVRWNEDPNEQMSFEAEASLGLLGFQGVLREEDTGNYRCALEFILIFYLFRGQLSFPFKMHQKHIETELIYFY